MRRVDARVRHSADVCVTVSGRTQGRAQDGMADTIRRRIKRQDDMVDGAMEPVADRVRRIGARRLLRLAWNHVPGRRGTVRHLSMQLGLSEEQLEGWLALPYFGAAWAQVEAASPVLVQRVVARRELDIQMSVAREVLARLERPATPTRQTRVMDGRPNEPHDGLP